jgi:hypothetical protein
MAFTKTDTAVGFPAVTSTIADGDYLAPAPLGAIAQFTDPDYGTGEFIYLKGLDNTAVGSVVTYNTDDYTTTLAVADAIGPVAIAMAATATDQTGWYQIQGKGVAKVLTGFADNANCYLTSTAGSIDDAVVAGDYIYGMKGASAIGTPSAGLAEIELSRPFVKNGLDDATS